MSLENQKKIKTENQKKICNKSSEEINSSNKDIIKYLYQRNLFESILEPQIWSRLDWKDLRSAIQVSKSWKVCVGGEKDWKERLFKRARVDGKWRHVLQELLDKLTWIESQPPTAPGSSDLQDAEDPVKRLQRSLERRAEDASPCSSQIYFIVAQRVENFLKFWKDQDKTDPRTCKNKCTIIDHVAPRRIYHFADQKLVVCVLDENNSSVLQCYSDAFPFEATLNINVGIWVGNLASFGSFLIAPTGDSEFADSEISAWHFENPRSGATFPEKPNALAPVQTSPRQVLVAEFDSESVEMMKVRGNMLIAVYDVYNATEHDQYHIRVWRLERGLQASSMEGCNSISAISIFESYFDGSYVDFDVDPQFVAFSGESTSGELTELSIWSLETGLLVKSLRVEGNDDDDYVDGYNRVLFLPETDYLVFGDENGVLRLLSKSTKMVYANFQGKPPSAHNSRTNNNNIDIELNNNHFNSSVMKLEPLEKHYFVASYQGNPTTSYNVFNVQKVICQCSAPDYQEIRRESAHAILNIEAEYAFELESDAEEECFGRENIFFTRGRVNRLYGLSIN